MAKKLYVNGVFDFEDAVKSVNGIAPDDEGNVEVEIPESAGKSIGGETVVIDKNGTTAVAGEGAEIFNDYRDRTYVTNIANSNDTPTAGNMASGEYSHAEGTLTSASEFASHAEGCHTKAYGRSSHAEGEKTTASSVYSHAEGYLTKASHRCSHAEGEDTIAAGRCQHVQGKFNVSDNKHKYAHIVGNGEDNSRRSNAHTLDWNGVGWFAGGLKVGGTGQDDETARDVVLVPEGAAAHQVLVTDAEGNEKWEDKTHYKSVSIIEVFPKQIVACESNDEALSAGFAMFNVNCNCVLGETYTVIFNGVEYESVARNYNDENVYFGDLSVQGYGETDEYSNGEPFCIRIYDGSMMFVYTETVGEYELSIVQRRQTIKRIDAEYHAPGVGADKVLVTNSEGNTVWEDKPFGIKDVNDLVYNTVTYTPDMLGSDTSGYFFVYDEENYIGELLEGKTYSVVFNDTEYSLTCEKVYSTTNDRYYLFVGNNDLGMYPEISFTEDGLPFCVAEDTYTGAKYLIVRGPGMWQKPTNDITITVASDYQEVTHLSEKYLPTTVPVLSAAPTAEDAGKFLTILEDGTVGLVAIPNAEEASF